MVRYRLYINWFLFIMGLIPWFIIRRLCLICSAGWLTAKRPLLQPDRRPASSFCWLFPPGQHISIFLMAVREMVYIIAYNLCAEDTPNGLLVATIIWIHPHCLETQHPFKHSLYPSSCVAVLLSVSSVNVGYHWPSIIIDHWLADARRAVGSRPGCRCCRCCSCDRRGGKTPAVTAVDIWNTARQFVRASAKSNSLSYVLKLHKSRTVKAESCRLGLRQVTILNVIQ